MKIQVDKDNRVAGFAMIGELVGAVEFDGDVPDDFELTFYRYKLVDGALVKDDSYISDIEKESIRVRRERDCFPIVNRGMLWYKHLTESQVSELETWYRLWLDAPQTGSIPDMPEWLLKNYAKE